MRGLKNMLFFNEFKLNGNKGPLNLDSSFSIYIQLKKTPAFLHTLSLKCTTPAFALPSCTSPVQPLDISLNKLFKDLIDAQYNQHFEANLDAWSLDEYRILMTQWICAAYEMFSHDYKDAIRASFVKYGIALPIDGSQGVLINIHGLNNYTAPLWPTLNLQQSPTEAPAASEPGPESYTELLKAHNVIILQMMRMQALSRQMYWMREGRWTIKMQEFGKEGFRVK